MGDETLRVGVIGCGKNGTLHAKRMASIENVHVAAVCDPDAEKAEAAQQAVGEAAPHVPPPAPFGDHERMLGEANLDAVVISSPHTAHYQQIMDALGRGLHVLTEKPMVTTVEHAEEVVAEVERAGRIVGVSYQQRGLPSSQWVRSQVLQGHLGALQFVSGLVAQDWINLVVASHREWRFDPKLSGGGQLADSGSHMVDLLFYVTNQRPVEVVALMEKKDMAVDVFCGVSFRLEGGTLGTLSVLGEGAGRMDVLVWGENGMTEASDRGVFSRRREERFQERRVEDDELPPAVRPDENFVEAIRNGQALLAPVEAGEVVARFTEAVYQSAETGRRMTIEW